MPFLIPFQEAWLLEEIVKVIEMATERYHVNVAYPEYHLSKQPLNTFNVAIFNKITGYVKEFTDSAGQMALPNGIKSELQGAHSTYTAVNRFITTKVDFYPYLGGVHPGHNIVTITFDTAENAIVSLSDFFAGERNYLQLLSSLTEKALFDQYPDLDFAFSDPTFRKGFAPAKENFSHWALSNHGLIIFFPEYQVAPYAAGALYITIPYQAIFSGRIFSGSYG